MVVCLVICLIWLFVLVVWLFVCLVVCLQPISSCDRIGLAQPHRQQVLHGMPAGCGTAAVARARARALSCAYVTRTFLCREQTCIGSKPPASSSPTSSPTSSLSSSPTELCATSTAQVLDGVASVLYVRMVHGVPLLGISPAATAISRSLVGSLRRVQSNLRVTTKQCAMGWH